MSWCCEIDEIHNFIKTAAPNDRLEYFIGVSIQDTILSKEIAKITYKYAERGLVYLVQKRAIGYYYDFHHYMIKASYTPIYRLVPLSDEKTEQLRRTRGVRNYGKDQRTSKVFGVKRYDTV